MYPDASFTVKINLVVDSLFTGISLKNCAEISSADNDLDSTNISPVDIDSSPDKIMDNDIFGGYHLIDNSNNDEDDHDCEIINVAGNKDSSSILKMLDTHVDNAPNSKYIGKQEIQIKSLDSIIVDTAPVGLVADTLLIAEQADATVFVARANYLDNVY